MKKRSMARCGRGLVVGLALMSATACSWLLPAATPIPSFYSLDSARTAPLAVGAPATAPTLTVNPPRAAAGFDSSRIIYVRERYQLEYFAHSEWVDPPARMLAPLLLAALDRTGAFRAVVLAPSGVGGDLRLDTEIIRLQHEFTSLPSRVRFTLLAYLVDDKTHRVLARQEFDTSAPAVGDDPYGGVVAANRAVQKVLASLAAFCAETARGAPQSVGKDDTPSIPGQRP